MHSHGSHTVEDPHGRWWRYFRSHRWFYSGSQDDAERGHNDRMLMLGIEWHVDSWAQWREFKPLACVKLSLTGEETIDTAIGIGPFDLYTKLDLERPTWTKCPYLSRAEKYAALGAVDRLAVRAIREATSDGAPPRHDASCRECLGTGQVRPRRHVRLPLPIRFTVDLDLDKVTRCLGDDPHSWESDASWVTRLRRNDLHWWRVHRMRRSVEEVRTVEVTVPLPEGGVPATVTLERSEWAYEVGPYSLSRRSKHRLRFWLPVGRRVLWHTDLKCEQGLPFPGKGENSYDCGPDAYYGEHAPCRPPHDPQHDTEWVAQAIGNAVESTLRARARYGGGVTDTGR